MATIRRRATGKWEAQIRRLGQPSITRTFSARADAEKWARATEREMDTGQFLPRTDGERTTVADACERYAREVLPGKKSRRQIASDLTRLIDEWGPHSLIALTPERIAAYRDRRLQTVSGDQVRKELGLLGRVYRVAMTDWGIHVPHGAPTDRVRLPPAGRGRERRVSDAELDAILAVTGSRELPSLSRVAVETAMRRGELTALTWEHVDLRRRVVHLPETKNGQARDVPLSTRARDELAALPRRLSGRVWGLTPDAASRAFARAVQAARARYVETQEAAGVTPDPDWLVGVRLHDLRHEATSRLFERGLSIVEVSAITGHTDLAMLRRYTHLRADDLVARLG